MKHIIRRILLNEVAGISFEVREWAQIIEQVVKEKMAEARKNLPQPSYGGSSYYSYDYDDYKIEPLGTEFTHFVDEDGDEHDEAYVYGEDITQGQNTSKGLDDMVKGVQFKITIDDGFFYVKPVGGTSLSDDAIEELEVMVDEYAAMGGVFFGRNYEMLVPTSHDEEDDQSWGYGGQQLSMFEDFTPTYYQPLNQVTINGKDYPEAYEKFSVDKWVITSSDRLEYDHWRSGYVGDEYIVYLNMPLSSVQGSMLVHEIKHAYDDWNRMRHGGKPIRDSWEIKNIYTKDFEKLVLGGSFQFKQLHGMLRYYYLGSKLEQPAYLENVYDNNSFVNYRDIAKKMMEFKASNYMKKGNKPAKGLQEEWDDLNSRYNVPLFNSMPNVVDFLKYSEKYFNKRGESILKKIDKMRYVHGK